ncbi:hypothetical protein C8A05DRAFT_42130 [Staphylotrichum tortipilum]|uniref:Uncharacterized protein n=1 Tax=Staphylotrichum tortipilum TaxID=2831512 RepID=A0AAN6RWA1_9PEZI|nr:hypothetical protein C8A05DRAFT_42130 [Staphylotrichum longicolle]
MPRRRLALWAAALAAIPAAAASAVPINDLFTRQSTCAPNFNQCKNANFPSYFCCPSGQRCLSLAGNTTLLCCPEGSDCLKIQPVPCDISLQDGEKNPDAVVKTTALGGTLSRCGPQCCPFGYSCVGTECVMDRNQNPAPIQTKTSTPGPTSTASSKTSAISSAEATSTSDATSPTNNPSTTSAASDQASTSSNGPPVAAIAGGVTAAAVVLIGSAIFMFIFLRKRNKEDKPEAGSPPKLSRSTSSFGNLISGPIMAENTAFRTDFARGVQSPNASDAEEPASVTADLIGSSVSSPDSGMLAVPAPTATRAGANRQSGVAYGGGGYGGLEQSTFDPSPFVDMPYVDHDNGLSPPRTPRQPREPSSVSINIFADPNITPDRTPESGADRRYTSMTTFTQMLDRADLGGIARGESYLPYSPTGAPPVPKRG